MQSISSKHPETSSTNAQDGANAERRAIGVQDHEAGLRTKLIFWQVKRRLGHIPLSLRIHARDPKLLQLAAGMSKHMAEPGKISAKLKELAQLKVAAIVGCPF